MGTAHPPQTRVYFGPEFCQTLLPAPSALSKAIEALAAPDQGFTFVTPPVDDQGLAKVAALLEVLASCPGRAEVVVNDWGVLHLLRRAEGRFTPVLGRLLVKLLRDPRLRIPADVGVDELLPAQQSGVTSQLTLLRSAGVEWVELDTLRQGLRLDLAAVGLRPSVHLPFGYVASGRVCLFAGLNQPRTAKFASGTPCQRECRRYQVALTDAAAEAGPPLLQQGNTVFARKDAAELDQGLRWASEQRGRVVVRHTPFDELGHATERVDQARAWLEQGVPR